MERRNPITRLLIGTYHSLLWWDGATHLIASGVHYGITWDREHIYASYNPSSGGTVIEVYDRHLACQGTLPIAPLEGTHQILWDDGEGVLYITNTRYNRLATWDGEQQGTVHWDEFWNLDPPKDTLHINSIWCDGDTRYVCEHGYAHPPARIRIFDRDFQEQRLIELDFAVHDDLNAHNVYVEDGTMYVCRHRHIDVRELDGTLIDRVFPLGEDSSAYLLRGLARTKDHFYVGMSTYAPREQRGEGDSDILVLDSQLRVQDAIFLKGTGQVYEIRVLDEVDYAHNQVRYSIDG